MGQNIDLIVGVLGTYPNHLPLDGGARIYSSMPTQIIRDRAYSQNIHISIVPLTYGML